MLEIPGKISKQGLAREDSREYVLECFWRFRTGAEREGGVTRRATQRRICSSSPTWGPRGFEGAGPSPWKRRFLAFPRGALSLQAHIKHFERNRSWRRWHSASLEARSKLGLSPDYKPLAHEKFSFRGVPPHLERMREALEIAYASIPAAQRSSARSGGFYMDLSQCVTREKWGQVIKTLYTSTILYDFAREKVCSGFENLLLQGMPAELDYSMLAESKRRQAAGEAMFAPSIASVLVAVVLSRRSPWWVEAAPGAGAKRARTETTASGIGR